MHPQTRASGQIRGKICFSIRNEINILLYVPDQ